MNIPGWNIAEIMASLKFIKGDRTQKVITVEERLKYMKELILALYIQGCAVVKGKYDHCCTSTYEEAQDFLIKEGLLKKSKVYRK